MTEEQQQLVEQRIQSGYPLSSSVCLAAGFAMYKRHFYTFALYSLIVPVLSLFFGVAGLGVGGMLILALVISPILNAGFYTGADQIARENSLEYRDFFKVFPKAFPLVISNLAAFTISALILIPLYYILENIGMFEWYQSVAENPTAPPEPPLMSQTQSTTFFLNLIPLLYLQVGFSWAFLFILFYDTNPLAALEWSRRLVTRRWGAQFMLLLTFASIFMLASMMLSALVAINIGLANVATMGLFLLFPWAYCSLYVGFRGATEFGREEEE